MIRSNGAATRGQTWPAGSFLATLREPQLRELMQLGAVSTYARGETILNQGHPGESVLLLLRGVVKIFQISGEGDELLLALRSRGAVIGELAFVTGQPRSARVVAANDVTARAIKGADFQAFLDRFATVRNQLTAAVITKLQQANARRAEFRFYTATGRLAIAVSDAAHAVGTAHDDGGLALGPEVTQADLAGLASVSISVAERTLREWDAAGLVVRRRKVLIVTDPQALRALAENERRNPSRDG